MTLLIKIETFINENRTLTIIILTNSSALIHLVLLVHSPNTGLEHNASQNHFTRSTLYISSFEFPFTLRLPLIAMLYATLSDSHDCPTLDYLLCPKCPPAFHSPLLASLQSACVLASECDWRRRCRSYGILSLCALSHRLLFQGCLDIRQ